MASAAWRREWTDIFRNRSGRSSCSRRLPKPREVRLRSRRQRWRATLRDRFPEGAAEVREQAGNFRLSGRLAVAADQSARRESLEAIQRGEPLAPVIRPARFEVWDVGANEAISRIEDTL